MLIKILLTYLKRIGIALSVLINVILGGPNNQTFSARNHGWKRDGKPNLVWLIDRIFFMDHNHCLNSWVYWYIRKDVENDKNIWEYTVSMVRKSKGTSGTIQYELPILEC